MEFTRGFTVDESSVSLWGFVAAKSVLPYLDFDKPTCWLQMFCASTDQSLNVSRRPHGHCEMYVGFT